MSDTPANIKCLKKQLKHAKYYTEGKTMHEVAKGIVQNTDDIIKSLEYANALSYANPSSITEEIAMRSVVKYSGSLRIIPEKLKNFTLVMESIRYNKGLYVFESIPQEFYSNPKVILAGLENAFERDGCIDRRVITILYIIPQALLPFLNTFDIIARFPNDELESVLSPLKIMVHFTKPIRRIYADISFRFN